MIASLFGEVTDKSLSQVILEVNGVGYGIYITALTYDELIVGEKCKLFIHESVREDAYDLYGFLTVQSKKLFELCISVKNVGPKVALALLSVTYDDNIRKAIAAGDVRLLMSAKGVGKKAAEQLIVELRDKVGLVASADAEDVILRAAVDPNDEALQALVSLGYSETDAANSLKGIDPKLPVNDRLKQALKGASK